MSDTPKKVRRFKAAGPWITRDLRDCVLASDYDELERELAAAKDECERLREDAERYRQLKADMDHGGVVVRYIIEVDRLGIPIRESHYTEWERLQLDHLDPTIAAARMEK